MILLCKEKYIYCGLTGQETDRFFVGLATAILSLDEVAVASFGRAGCEPGLPAPGWSGVFADVDATWRQESYIIPLLLQSQNS